MGAESLGWTLLVLLFFVALLVGSAYLLWLNRSTFWGFFRGGLSVASVSFNSASGTPPTYSVDLTATPSNVTRQATAINLNDCSMITDMVDSQPVIRMGILRQAIYVMNLDVVYSVTTDSISPVVSLYPDVYENGNHIDVPSTLLPFAEETSASGETKSLHVTHQINLPAGATVSMLMASDTNATLAIESWSINLTQLQVQ